MPEFHKAHIQTYISEIEVSFMKIMKKFVTFITIIAVVFVLVVPVQAEAGAKSSPKLNKTKVTLDLAGKKTKTYQLKVQQEKSL